jgi:hypothetical protein
MAEINQTDKEDYGHIFVQFVSPGSVFFDFEMGGIVPLQMVVIGEYFLTLGKSQLLQEQAQVHQGSDRKQIEIARPNISSTAVSRALRK